LTDIFRYLLQSDRSFIPLSEELRIIRAYLEIEALRLGDRLETVLDVEESALSVIIPILSVQPLVENAVKHGVAPRMGRGRVVLRVRNDDGILRVIVQDSGSGFAFKQESGDNGGGVGLANVRRRLHLSYGAAAILEVDSSELGSTVTLAIPCTSTFQYEKQEVEVG
jgi:LytS/YehU family sensor histidine kinase